MLTTCLIIRPIFSLLVVQLHICVSSILKQSHEKTRFYQLQRWNKDRMVSSLNMYIVVYVKWMENSCIGYKVHINSSLDKYWLKTVPQTTLSCNNKIHMHGDQLSGSL